MQRITPDRAWPLFDVAATRRAEERAAADLAPCTLVQRAGLATARLALALAPHARRFWIACGPGNNGADGMEAALHLQQWGKEPLVTWTGAPDASPPDALAARQRALDAGVQFMDEPPADWDFALDALLGIGKLRPIQGPMMHLIDLLNTGAPVLAVDLPSGLNAETGQGAAVRASHTLCLLTLKPGLFTGGGRDAAGQVWFDDLGIAVRQADAAAQLIATPARMQRLHSSHKGSYGDVAIIGGARGMTGAALLAAGGALRAGAGRVFVGLLDDAAPALDPEQPELMLRPWNSLDLAAMSVVCGCGGGDAVGAALPSVLSKARNLVLDADALNAIAADARLQAQLLDRSRRDGGATVITPHPLEAARLLGCAVQEVQADRLAAARALVERYGCVAVLKGSGTVLAAPHTLPAINPTGNARLATAGTGDVLAGMIAAGLAAGGVAFNAACDAVHAHGLAADQWPAGQPFTAGALAHGLTLNGKNEMAALTRTDSD